MFAIIVVTVIVVTCCYAVRVGKRHKLVECRSVRPSVRLSRRLAAAAAAGGFAAEVGRGQQISIDSCCCRATCGPRKMWFDCKEVQRACYYCHSTGA